MTRPGSRAPQGENKVIPGFEHVSRYWDRSLEINVAKILPGEYYVTNCNEGITTVLGSCVAACIRDKLFGIGGMNYFMLPVQNEEDALNLLFVGDTNRIICETPMNDASSRSHCIFTIHGSPGDHR